MREAYLQFFAEKKGHLRLPSASLIPANDPTLLMIGAGMAPFKPFFTGKMKPPRTRITTSQRCVRTGDIENVGRTATSLLETISKKRRFPGRGSS